MRVHIIAYGTLGRVADLGRKRLDHESWQKQLYIHNAINLSSPFHYSLLSRVF